MRLSGHLFLIGLVSSILTAHVLSHGWSPEMRAMLQAAPPEWLQIGKPIKVEPASESFAREPSFRSPAGDSRSTRDRVLIPGRGIEIKVDYPIDWYFGSSLSPDGTKLIINSGSKSRLLQINADGTYRPSELRVPYVTYDDGPKGFISAWSWAGNDTLIGEAEIDNERGEFIEKRIYVFHLKQSALSRLDVSALNTPSLEGLTVSKIAEDLNHLIISVGGKDFTVKADLHTPPSVEKQQERAIPPKLPPTVQPPNPTAPTPLPTAAPDTSPGASTPVAQTPAVPAERRAPAWLWLVGILALLVIAGLVLKRRT